MANETPKITPKTDKRTETIVIIAGCILAVLFLVKVYGSTKGRESPTKSDHLPLISDLNAVNLKLNLEKKGFTCKDTYGKIQHEFRCKWSKGMTDYESEAFGSNINKIWAVEGTVIQPDGNFAGLPTEFLSFIASIPYKDSDPKMAMAWVAENVNNIKANTVIGEARFVIYGTAAARIVKILHKDRKDF